MFDQNYYIKYIRKYEPTNSRHNVAWIEANYDYIIIDSEDYPMTSPVYLARPCDEFDMNSIGTFYIRDNSYPYRSEWLEPFNTEGIFLSFYSDTIQYPFPTVGWAAPFDGNNVFSFLFIKEEQYPFPIDWLEPFDANGIYSMFFLDTQYFHGYPNLKEIPTYNSTPETWIPITTDEIDKDIDVQGEKTITSIEDLNKTIKTQSEILQVKDRDIYKEEYQNAVDAYWQRQLDN